MVIFCRAGDPTRRCSVGSMSQIKNFRHDYMINMIEIKLNATYGYLL